MTLNFRSFSLPSLCYMRLLHVLMLEILSTSIVIIVIRKSFSLFKGEFFLFNTKITAMSNNKYLKLKVVFATFLLVCFLSLKESTCDLEKCFCFTSKALSVLEKIKFKNFRYSNSMTSSDA